MCSNKISCQLSVVIVITGLVCSKMYEHGVVLVMCVHVVEVHLPVRMVN